MDLLPGTTWEGENLGDLCLISFWCNRQSTSMENPESGDWEGGR